MKRELGQIIYPMSMLHDFLTDEEIKSLGVHYDFDPEDTHFHFEWDYNEDGTGMLESTNRAQTEWFNDGLPKKHQHIFFEDMTPHQQKYWLPKRVRK